MFLKNREGNEGGKYRKGEPAKKGDKGGPAGGEKEKAKLAKQNVIGQKNRLGISGLKQPA